MAEELNPEIVAIRALRAARLAAKKEGRPFVEPEKAADAVKTPKKAKTRPSIFP